MRIFRPHVIFAIAISLLQVSGVASAADDSLQVTTQENGHLLQVGVSKLQLFVPDLRLVNQTEKLSKSVKSNRYFYFEDDVRGLILSGWFEPAHRFQGLTPFWSSEKESWKKRGLPDPENVEVLQIGNWQAIFYDINTGPEPSLHVRAELLQAGTWVDLHISMLTAKNAAASRLSLQTLLQGIVVREKNGSDGQVRSYTLQNHGTLELKIPVSWQDSVAQPPGALPPTITFSPKTGAAFQVMVTPLWTEKPDAKPATSDELHAIVRRTASEAAQQSVEKSIEVKVLKGSGNSGYYFSATDRAPKPGEFKYLNQGIIGVHDLQLTFTILTNDGQDATVTEALSLLSAAIRR